MSLLQVANITLNAAESTRIAMATANSLTFTVNSANVLHVSNERSVVAGNLSFAGGGTVGISGANTQTDIIRVSGNTITAATINVAANVESTKVIQINQNLNIASQSGLLQNDQNLSTWTFINSQSFSGVSNLASPSLGGWKIVRVHFANVTSSVNNALVRGQLSADDGATRFTEAEYRYVSASASFQFDSVASVGLISFFNPASQGLGSAATDGGGDLTLTMYNWSSTSNIAIIAQGNMFISGASESPLNISCTGPRGPWNKIFWYSTTAGPPLLTGRVWYEGIK